MQAAQFQLTRASGTVRRFSSSSSSQKVIEFARSSLLKNEELLAHLSDKLYTNKHPGFYNASIGSHMRHTLDHYSALLDRPFGTIASYDERQRGTDVENNRAAALKRNRELMEMLDCQATDEAVEVSFHSNETTTLLLTSTMERELQFVAHHATHHHAMIRLMLGDDLSDLGLAVSTKNHNLLKGK